MKNSVGYEVSGARLELDHDSATRYYGTATQSGGGSMHRDDVIDPGVRWRYRDSHQYLES